MKEYQIHSLFFSPNGTTKTTVNQIAKGLGTDQPNELDLTDFNERWTHHEFCENDLVIIGLPVYSGRLVTTAKEILNHVKGFGALCVPVVTYGNRDYEDALLELVNGMTKNGFKCVAGGAFIGEHSFSSDIASQRPDARDIEKLIEFGQHVAALVESLGDEELESVTLKVKGNEPYRHASDIPLSPSVSDACKLCGACVKECPMKAIDPYNPKRTDNFRCIMCMKCVKNCPSDARGMTVDKFHQGVETLKFICGVRREPDTFFIK